MSLPSPDESPPIDVELMAVAREIRKIDPEGLAIGQVLRETLDQLYYGERTGRYHWKQLCKTEKTHCGTLVEINLLQRFLEYFKDAEKLDYKIAGVEVDCKYSQDKQWMIPPEAHGHLCLVVWADDYEAVWSLGIVRATPERLHLKDDMRGKNRDSKATLNKEGRQAIFWLFQDAPLPPNILLQLSPEDLKSIFAFTSGTKKLDQLFRVALGRLVGRAAVATVGKQKDFTRRVRRNGGSRSSLQKDGIVIVGPYTTHTTIAKSLGILVPRSGEYISIRLSPADAPGEGVARIDGGYWRVARPSDPVVDAPHLPSPSAKEADE